MLKNKNSIFRSYTDAEFQAQAVEVFNWQYKQNAVYRQWVDLLKINPASVSDCHQIPFLPIEFFKNFKVISASVTDDTVIFTSSATTSQVPSSHYVNDVTVYEKSFR